jgi:hypothetical protein
VQPVSDLNTINGRLGNFSFKFSKYQDVVEELLRNEGAFFAISSVLNFQLLVILK